MVVLELSELQINLLKSLIAERRRMTEYTITFYENEWTIASDKEYHLALAYNNWHVLDAVYKELDATAYIQDIGYLEHFLFGSTNTQYVPSTPTTYIPAKVAPDRAKECDGRPHTRSISRGGRGARSKLPGGHG
jgi:hypothetical protein